MPSIAFALCSAVVAVFTTVAMLSQVVRSYRSKTGDGFSLLFLYGAIWSSFAWTIYGVLRSQMIQIYCNVPWVMVYGLVVYYLWKEGRAKPGRVFGAFALMVAVTFGLMVVDWRLIGVLCMGLSAAFRLPQLYRCWKDPGGMGISVGSYIAHSAVHTSWIAVGFGYNDGFIIATSVYALVTSLYIGGSTYLGRRRRGHVGVPLQKAYAA